MKRILFNSATLLVLSGLLLFSCKDKETEPDLDQNTTTDNANSQSLSDDLVKVTEDALTTNGNAKMSAAGSGISCASIDTTKPNSNTTVYTLTFSGGICADGKTRSGTVVATLTGSSYNTPGASLSIVTSNYTVNGVKLEGKKTVTCLSNTNNQPVHTIEVSDGAGTGYAKITYSNGDIAQWKSQRTRTLVSGGGDNDITNNVYDITTTTGVGNPAASGINRNGRSYTIDIVSPLRVDFNCFANNTARYPTQGVLNINPSGKTTRSIDYGNGTCDNAVTVTINNKSYNVTLAY
jgi:hypothetical protein